MKRPRQHILETESKNAFENLVPSEWVVRELSPDYGLDYQVEIFSDGVSLGEVFCVQMKGTDQVSKNGVYTLDLDKKYFEYYQTLSFSVLLVLYSSQSNELFGVWANKYLAAYPLRQNQQKVRVRFGPGTRLDRGFLRRFENLSISNVCDWKSVFFKIDNSVSARTFYQVLRRWVELAYPDSLFWEDETVPRYISYEIAEVESGLSVTITDPEVGNFDVDDIDINSSRHNIDFPIYEMSAVPAEFSEILFVTALSLIDYSPKESIFLIGKVFPIYQGTFNDIEAKLRIARSIFDYGSIYFLEGIVDACIENDDLRCVEEMNMAIFLLLNERNYRVDLIELYKSNLEKLIGRSDSASYRAMLRYNYANAFRGERRPRECLGWYLKAKKEDKEYLRRGYWWKEMAGQLFLLRRYRWAASAYEKAYSLGDGVYDDVLALIADSWFMSRDFKSSVAWFEKYFERAGEPVSEWIVKERIARFMVSNDLLVTRAKPEEAKILALNSQHEEIEVRQKEVIKAIELDPLCMEAWFSYGVNAAEAGDFGQAKIGFVTCFSSDVTNIRVLVNAAFMAFSDKDDELFLLLLDIMFNKFGNNALFEVREVVQEQKNMDRETKQQFYEAFSEIYGEVRDNRGVWRERGS